MIWIAVGTAAAVASTGLGALAAFILHRREKARRLPDDPERSMWSGT